MTLNAVIIETLSPLPRPKLDAAVTHMKNEETRTKSALTKLLCVVVAVTATTSAACAGSDPAKPRNEVRAEKPVPAVQPPAAPPMAPAEAVPVAAAAVAESTTTLAPNLAPARPAEVSAALARAYQGAVEWDARGGGGVAPAIVGDFNGDGSADLAVVVQCAAGKLEELNSEFANWTVRDPHDVVLPDKMDSAHRGGFTAPVTVRGARVDEGDRLLAIIHGVGQQGWRSADAKQTYLLKNAAGSRMKSQPLVDFMKTAGGSFKPQKLAGDVIVEDLHGTKGALYWTGANYGWHQ